MILRPTYIGDGEYDTNWFLAAALIQAEDSDCERRKVGAIIVRDRWILSAGYNSAPMFRNGCHSCPRRQSGVEPYSDYSNCVAVHAEARALLRLSMNDPIFTPQALTVMYVSCEPCHHCKILLAEAGIPYIWPGGNSGRQGESPESMGYGPRDISPALREETLRFPGRFGLADPQL